MNPVAQFIAILSCRDALGSIVNFATDPVPATPTLARFVPSAWLFEILHVALDY